MKIDENTPLTAFAVILALLTIALFIFGGWYAIESAKIQLNESRLSLEIRRAEFERSLTLPDSKPLETKK